MRIIDFVIKRLLAWRYPHLVDTEGGAIITATDVEGYDYEYVPSLGIFDPVQVS